MHVKLYIAVQIWRKLCTAQIFCYRKQTSYCPSGPTLVHAEATRTVGCCQPMTWHSMVSNVGPFLQVVNWVSGQLSPHQLHQTLLELYCSLRLFLFSSSPSQQLDLSKGSPQLLLLPSLSCSQVFPLIHLVHK